MPISRHFGVDIDVHSLRVAVVRAGKQHTVRSVNEIALTHNPFLKNGIRNKEELQAKIKEACDSAKPRPIKLTKAVCSLPESSVFSKVINLPRLAKAELAQTIPFEAADFLPMPLDEMYLDWHIDDVVTLHKDKPTQQVLVVAAPKKLVDDLQDVFIQAGFELLCLESEPFSLARSLGPLMPTKTVSVILNFAHHVTTIILANRSVIKYTATIPIGSEKLAKHNQVYLRAIGDEIQESIRYYHNRLGEEGAIQMILLTGAGAMQSTMTKDLQNIIKIPCYVGHAPVKLPNNAPVHPRFNTVIGLSLWKQL